MLSSIRRPRHLLLSHSAYRLSSLIHTLVLCQAHPDLSVRKTLARIENLWLLRRCSKRGFWWIYSGYVACFGVKFYFGIRFYPFIRHGSKPCPEVELIHTISFLCTNKYEWILVEPYYQDEL